MKHSDPPATQPVPRSPSEPPAAVSIPAAKFAELDTQATRAVTACEQGAGLDETRKLQEMISGLTQRVEELEQDWETKSAQMARPTEIRLTVEQAPTRPSQPDSDEPAPSSVSVALARVKRRVALVGSIVTVMIGIVTALARGDVRHALAAAWQALTGGAPPQ